MSTNPPSRAVVFTEFGSPDVLRLVDVEAPSPGPGEVRVRMRAAAVNPLDFKIRNGWVQEVFPTTFPCVLGQELAGVVDEVGAGVTEWAVGDEVAAWSTNGSYRDLGIAAAAEVFRKPESVSWEVAGGIGAAGETAARALDELGVTEGETLVVHAAAGGVGTIAAQLAVRRGATVIGTASEGNHDYLRSLGVIPVAYGDGLADRIRAVAPDGVDWAFDCAGRDALPASIELTGSPDRVMTIADVRFPEYGVRFTGTPSHRHVVGDLLQLLADGDLQLPIDSVFSLADAPAAHRHSENGHSRGRIVLVP